MGRALRPGETFMDALREASAFFAKEGPVYDALARVTRHFADAGIDYAITGGMAMAAHGYMRFTADVDVLLARERIDAAAAVLHAAGYRREARRRWHDGLIPIDLFAVDDPASIAIEIDGIQVIVLEKLIDHKLASERLHDLADVQRLIEGLNLPLDFADKLDPSVREKYIEYWHGHQNATGPDRE